MASNKHLNLFRFYAESGSDPLIENNLTRALALCLRHEPVFLQQFLLGIDKNFYQELEEFYPENYNLDIDLQIKSKGIDPSGITKIIALSLTTHKLDENKFNKIKGRRTDSPTDDLVLVINDTLIICEVKRTSEDCRPQLKNQIDVFLENYKKEAPRKLPNVSYKSLTWKGTVKLIESSRAMIGKGRSLILDSFYDFLLENYPEWNPTKRLATVSFPKDSANSSLHLINNILSVIISKINHLQKNQPSGSEIPIRQLWALKFELLLGTGSLRMIGIGHGHRNLEKQVITLSCWPGDTKGQGKSLFNGTDGWEWLKDHEKEITIAGISGTIEVEPYIKLSHFRGKIISHIWNVKKELFTRDFFNKTGKWDKADWKKLDNLLSQKVGKDWKAQCDWESHFANSGRNFAVINMAAQYSVLFPYSDIAKLDKKEGIDAVADFFNEATKKVIANIERR